MTALIAYERARAALAEAKSAPEILAVRDELEHVKLYGRQVKDRTLVADASELQMRAERRLGELLIEAEKEGLIGPGRPKKRNGNPQDVERFTLAEAGIDHNLSAKAQKVAELDEASFEQTVGRMRDRIVGGAATVIDKEVATQQKKAKRATHERTLGDMQLSLPQKKYGVIVADPEWRFEPYSRETGMDRSPDNHYSTTTVDQIADRDVGAIAARDCVLFLWATAPMLEQAIVVLKAWGFDYKSHYVWLKDRIGTGYWARNQHELLLIGTKGNVPAPAMGEQRASVIEGRVTRHSAKPDIFLEMIEGYYPTLPKIELNRRGPARPGWDAWGAEAEPAADEEAA